MRRRRQLVLDGCELGDELVGKVSLADPETHHTTQRTGGGRGRGEHVRAGARAAQEGRPRPASSHDAYVPIIRLSTTIWALKLMTEKPIYYRKAITKFQ